MGKYILIISFPALVKLHHIYPKYLDRWARANSVDPDQMPQNVASDLSLYCLPLIQQILETTAGSRNELVQIFRISMVSS